MNHLYSISKSFQVSILIVLTSFFSLSQQDFNHYQTLLSKGEMPADFSTPVSQKILNDLAANKLTFKTKLEAQNYLKKIHERLDEILYSGYVTYGDEVSVYLQDLASKLLKDDPELLKELRFYTIKSNETNAFSTAPGIIFVTTGLISQLSSEAQLAFVLAHEIAHYEKKHVHEEYLNYKKVGPIKRQDQILELSQFSKEKELEADQLALKRYHKMGYSSEELIGAFDVLMYSYLPFDEVAFPFNYFNTENMTIPEKKINVKIKPITAEENYNDTYSSHPNIKKRKVAVEKAISEYADWGTNSFVLNEDLFFEIRTTCRLENIRLNIIEGSEFSALYTIFLLEKDFPNSLYLDKMKTLAWLSIIQLKFKFEKTKKAEQIEGESSLLYKFLNKCNTFELATIGLRVVYDLRAKHPGESFFEESYNFYVEAFSQEQTVSLSKYQPFTYQQASVNAINKTSNETAEKKETTPPAEGSKYSRIKEKRSTQSVPVFDSTEFAVYAISDILRDSSFVRKFTTLKEHNDSMKEASEQFYLLSKRDQEKAWKAHITERSKKEASFKDIVIVEPNIHLESKTPKAAWELAAAKKAYMKTLTSVAQKQGFNPIILTQDSIIQRTTRDFNEYNTYLAYMEQINSANNGNNCLSIDYDLINEFTQARGVSQVLFTQVEYFYFPEFDGFTIIAGTIVAPFIPYVYFVHIPRAIKQGKDLNMYSMLINTKSGKNYSYVQRHIHKTGTSENYSPYYSDFFNLIKQF
ncbi:M48 family metallopeptidase [Fluviicola sp.]|uniref:M48 family metallopeptidase n=1 Tax=Fluviicola sp. TaxID=1917219 RepID=UPI0026224975|nr:M48 family metallopeptidase [Fluviicola sp.]